MSLEPGRRVVHASGAAVPAAYLFDGALGIGILTWSALRALTVAGLLATAVLESARLYGGFEHTLFDRLTREYERDTVAGYALYVLGATVVVLAFEPRIALPALFMLTLADPISGVLSSALSGGGLPPTASGLVSVKHPGVLVGMFVVSFALAYPFVPAVVAGAGALGAAVADGVKPLVGGYVVDDNLTIPIAAAVAMHVAAALA